ncbi:MAG: ATP-binding protein [Blautia sp.]
MIRKIVHIDEALCNGCGACAQACHEGAIAMIDGKAKLIKDDYCDGLGDCLPACPTDAIRIIEREANAYDEKAVKARIKNRGKETAHVCPGQMARSHKRETVKEKKSAPSKEIEKIDLCMESQLQQWPVQIKLVPVHAPYFENAKLLIAADCTAYAYARFHQDFIKGHVTLIGCPKLDEGDYAEKLTEIIKQNSIKSIQIVRMEVPCCGGIENAAIRAMQESGKMIPWQVVTITCDGKIKED